VCGDGSSQSSRIGSSRTGSISPTSTPLTRLRRWETETDEWKVTLDVRPDHDRVWTDLHRTHVYVMTRVMELCRADEATFTVTEAEPVLTALHVGIWFALGYWAAPVLPVGEGAHGEVVWESWPGKGPHP
jgi:hypothetical protein